MRLAWAHLLFVGTVYSSYCGRSGVPFSVEVLPNGAPILGCAQPSCIAMPENGDDDSLFTTDVDGQPDGFFRDNDRTQSQTLQANKLFANCSEEFNELACTRKNQWVGGIEYIDHPRQPLILQCCTFDGLRFSQDVGVTIISAGEAVTGGEVIREGRQISFDVIANIKKAVDPVDHSISYEVTVRRMNCLPDPPEVEVMYDNEVPTEVVRVLGSANNGTVKKERIVKPDREFRKRRKYTKRPDTTGESAFGAPIYSPLGNSETSQSENEITEENTDRSYRIVTPSVRSHGNRHHEEEQEERRQQPYPRTIPTVPPTTQAPTTIRPLTYPPQTEPPTSRTSFIPITQAPPAPVTAAPVTHAPVTMFPTMPTLPMFAFPTYPPPSPGFFNPFALHGSPTLHAQGGLGGHGGLGGLGAQSQSPYGISHGFGQGTQGGLGLIQQPQGLGQIGQGQSFLGQIPNQSQNANPFALQQTPNLQPLGMQQNFNPLLFGQHSHGLFNFGQPNTQFGQVTAGTGGLAKPLTGQLPGYEENPEVVSPVIQAASQQNELLPNLYNPPSFTDLGQTLQNFHRQG